MSIADLAHTGFALGYAVDGTFPVPPRARAVCLAIQETAAHVDHPGIGGLILEAGKTEGRRAAREKSHTALYAFHGEAIAEILAGVLAKVDSAALAAKLVDLAAVQVAAGLNPVQRRQVVATAATAEITNHLTDDERQAMNEANADGFAHAQAHGIGEAQATPERGGPPDPKEVATLAAAALITGPNPAAVAVAEQWTVQQIDVTAMGAALAAGDGAGLSEATKRVTSALMDTGRATRAYADNLHRTVMQAYVDQIRERYPTRMVNFVTSGGNVCPLCLELEGENPYDPSSVPIPPQHWGCQCHNEMASESVEVAA